MNYTHASLFSGIGGAELAASWLGWQNLFHCEIQEFQRKVLEYWFPNSISYEDITKTDFKEWRGQIDVLTGGFPCQPFSMAGKRLGAKDDRYLWPHMLRAIREVQPTWVVCENVAGILSMVQPSEEVDMGGKASLFEENYRTREEQLYTIEGICQGLEQAGYSVQTLVIPACAVGAPHRRDRVWIIAHRTNARSESVQQRWQNGVSQPFFATNTDCLRPPRRNTQGKQYIQSRHRFEKLFRKESWKDFPTQPPICSRDDGISIRLANLTISFQKWRSKSIEALGNAWVPQVAYEIFKAIENYDNKVKID